MNADPIRLSRWYAAVLAAGLIPGQAYAQPPSVAPVPEKTCTRGGFFHRFLHHSAHTLHDKFIGYPENFVEPPLGYYLREQMTMQVAKADNHRFTLYRSDFLPGTDRFSPAGASRFNLMYSRMGGWMGPVTVEWTPDEPGLADSRRLAVLSTFQRAGRPIGPERVVIGPSVYPGGMGAEAANNHNSLIFRTQQAAQVYPPTPQSGAYAYSTGGGAQ